MYQLNVSFHFAQSQEKGKEKVAARWMDCRHRDLVDFKEGVVHMYFIVLK
jgi:hypothetical protein